jgi:hypothetical protein
MTTPKEALEFYADPIAWKKQHDLEDSVRVPDFYDETSFGDMAKEALASLQGEDTVERAARALVCTDPNYRIYHMPGDGPRDWMTRIGYRRKTSELTESAAESVRVSARAILATGLVPDEAAIRVDEREKCAKVAERDSRSILAKEVGYEPDFYKHARFIAAAIRAGDNP